MTNHNEAGQPVTLYTQDLINMFLILASLRTVITHAQTSWPQGFRDSVNKAYSLVDFKADGGLFFPDGRTFRISLDRTPADQNGGN